MSIPIELSDRETLIKSASTSLNSKVVSQYSDLLAPLTVDCINRVIKEDSKNVDLRDIKLIKKLGGTVEDTEMIDGLLLDRRIANSDGPSKVEKAKIALIQFCISPPKTDMDNKVIIEDYHEMDRALKEERAYILNIVKAVKKSGCNVLLIQKSILRDAVNELALHFLSKMKIMAVKDIEREDIEFVCKTLNCKPIASVDHLTPEAIGAADLVEEMPTGGGKVIKFSGIAPLAGGSSTVSVLIRGSNQLVIDEADRSIHDALCVIRCLVKKRALVAGGGAPEAELWFKLSKLSDELIGMDQFCYKAFAEALEVIPYTLAENAGLNAIKTVTELRNEHSAKGHVFAGINVKRGTISDMRDAAVLQPLLVSQSALTLATETVRLANPE